MTDREEFEAYMAGRKTGNPWVIWQVAQAKARATRADHVTDPVVAVRTSSEPKRLAIVDDRPIYEGNVLFDRDGIKLRAERPNRTEFELLMTPLDARPEYPDQWATSTLWEGEQVLFWSKSDIAGPRRPIPEVVAATKARAEARQTGDQARISAPAEIYLQGYIGSFSDEDVTWCDHRFATSDVRYVRADNDILSALVRERSFANVLVPAPIPDTASTGSEKPRFCVHMRMLEASLRKTYHVTLDRSDRPDDATSHDSAWRITPFMSTEHRLASREAAMWEVFLNGATHDPGLEAIQAGLTEYLSVTAGGLG